MLLFRMGWLLFRIGCCCSGLGAAVPDWVLLFLCTL